MLSVDDLTAAQRVLSRARGRRVQLHQLDEFRVGRVVRCLVEGDGDTVVVKVADRDADHPEADRGLAAIHAEQAALELLASLGSRSAASLLGVDPEAGVLVLEDLGDEPSLATVLLGADKEAASTGARASAEALGTLHSATIGHHDAFYEIREQLRGHDRHSDRFLLRGLDIRSGIEHLSDLVAQHDLPSMTGCEADLQSVIDELDEPGDFFALSSGDPCPDNERYSPDGVRFFDFEAATYRHALVDAAHYVLPFPNCWCWRRLPEHLSRAMLAAHRTQLATTSAQARDDGLYTAALARTSTAWVVWTLTQRLPRAADDALARTRIVTALANVSSLLGRSGELPRVNDYYESLIEIIEARWPDLGADVYPALGGAVWSA